MANNYNYVRGRLDPQDYAKDTTTTVIDIGDMVQADSDGLLALAATATDNLAFRGVAITASPAGSSATVRVAMANADSQWDFALDTTTTVKVGYTLKISGDSQVLAYDSGGTDTIAICTKAATDATTVRCKFKVPGAYLGDTSA